MIVLESKVQLSPQKMLAIQDAIRSTQFVRNKALRLWMDGKAKSCADLTRYCSILAQEFPFAKKLGSQARQAAAERAWASITRFYKNAKMGIKGYPKFQKDARSVEYVQCGWKLSADRRLITFTDGMGIGSLKLREGSRLTSYTREQIKRVRLVRRADGYYAQFCVAVDRREELPPTHNTLGLDVGIENFYTDSYGSKEENPRFLQRGQKKLKKAQRSLSRKVKGSQNRKKAKIKLGRIHLKISRQRKDHAVKLARCVVMSNDVIVYEDLRIRNMIRNHCLAKSIADASWYQFRVWLEYFGKVFGRITIAVNPAYTSQQCSACGTMVQKSLSTRTHACQCGCILDRDHNAALNILAKGLGTVGHTGTSGLCLGNASGEPTSTRVEAIQS